jgi:DNA-directed RNA polymerase beta' subunit
MYSLATGLENTFVRDIVHDRCQLVTGPACLACRPGSEDCDGIAGHKARGTLCDPVMGPRTQGERCRHQRCRLDFGACPGHPGRIVLARPCFAPHFEHAVASVLKLVCATCMRNPARFAGPGSCQPCGNPFESVKFVNGLVVMKSPMTTHRMDAAGVRGILAQLDTEALGVAKDIRVLVPTELEVLPTRYRPYTTVGSRVVTNPLTSLYANVIEANNAVLKGTNPLAPIDLQKAVNCLFSAKYSSSASAVSLVTSLGKKEGRIRHDLMGKRVGASARTVIVGDADLSICELGVPAAFAATLGYPMAVLDVKTGRVNDIGLQETHLDECRRLVRSGENWERCVIRGLEVVRASIPSSNYTNIVNRLASQLSVGDIVYRGLRDGDVVILNRQPTLHRNGFTAHVVRIFQDNVFRLPQNVTEQFNADFDGDEMNMHVPQTLQAIAELHVLLALSENFIAPNERPAFGFIQNSVVAAFKLTAQDALFTRAEACQLMTAASEPNAPRRACFQTGLAQVSVGGCFRPLPIPAVQFKKVVDDHWVLVERWTGSQLISCLMPPVDVEAEGVMEGEFVMQRGEIMGGRLSKRELGTGKNNLLHKVLLQYNGKEFFDSVNRLCANYLRGFTVGLRDCLIDVGGAPIHEQAEGPTTVHRMQHLRTLTQVFVEDRVDVRDNALRQMFESGSKGKALNTTQIVASVGPQDIGGRSPSLWLGARSLPCFRPGDESLVARGYVDTGYLEGLGPAAMFFHCAAARDSLVIAKMIPAETGALQRLMCECLKALHVDYEGRVVGEGGRIVQFSYGLDWTGQVVEPNTPVGAIAAMSLSEQTTQRALDSFHHVGELSLALPRLYELFYVYDRGTVRAEMATREAAMAFARRLSVHPVLAAARWATAEDFKAHWVRRWIKFFGRPTVRGRRAVHMTLDRSAFFFDTMRDFSEWLGEPAMLSHEKADKALEIIVFIPVDTIWDFLGRLDPRKIRRRAGIRVRVNDRVVEADGVRLKQADALMGDLPCVEMTSTNLLDVAKHRGIEAARQSLFEQASRLDAFSGVSPRHLGVLCDAMCASGELLATNFSGMGRHTESTLGKTVFQAPVPTFVHAAVTNRAERFDNVSACIITGERVPVGTGANFTLIMDDGLTPEGVSSNPVGPKPWYAPV